METKYNLQRLKHVLALICLLLFGSVQMAHAQINTNKIRVDLNSLSFKACNDTNNGLSTVTVQSKQATTTDFEIAFDFPDGVMYQAGSGVITTQTGSGDFTFSEIDISDLNQPIFGIERPSNAPWQINDQVTFTYQKTADCDAVQFSYSGGLFKDAHTISFNDTDGAQTASDNDPTVNSYNLLRAFLAVDPISDVGAIVNTPQTRNIILRNSGNGGVERFEHQVEVPLELQVNYQLAFNGTVLTPTNISGDFYTYEIDLNLAPFAGQVGDGDNVFENESIIFQETLELSNCAWGIGTRHSPRWGCSSGTFCQTGAPIFGRFNIVDEWANISVTEINKPLPRWDAPVTYTYGISNIHGTDNAYNVQLNIGYTWDGTLSDIGVNPLYGDDSNTQRQLSNFRFTGGAPFTPQRWANTIDPSGGAGSYYLPANFLTSDPDGPGGLEDLDGDGFFDDLAPGANTEMNFDLAMLPNTPACDEYSAEYTRNLSLRMDLWSVNPCNRNIGTDRVTANQHGVQREALFNWTNPESFEQDADDGEIFNLSFVGSFTVPSESPTCNGIIMLSNDPGTSYNVSINVPPGINLDSSADSRYSQLGNQVTFTETDLANFVRDGYLLEIPINFPLTLDCATYTGPSTIDLNYTSSYSSTCFNTDIHCGSFEVVTHCDTGCAAPTTTSFEANRTTAGWTDDNMTTRVTLDPAIHATKYYMPRDEMVITSSAVMRNDVRDNLSFEIRYVTRNDGTNISDIFAFDYGTITINDLSSGPQVAAITVAPTVTTSGTNDHLMTFDLSSYRSIISPTYEYGEGFEEDEIEVELHFRFKDNFLNQAELNEFYTFYGQFYSLDGGGSRVSCQYYNDRAFFFENVTGLRPNYESFVTGCEERWLSVTLEQSSGIGARFPNEYRPPLLWQSTSIEIPQGMTFNNVASSEGYPYLQPENDRPGSWNNGLSYTVSGNVVTITPGPRFRNLDQSGNNTPNINIPVVATSATPAVSNHNVSVTYLDYAYSDNPIVVTQTDNRDFTYFNAWYGINRVNPIEIGSSELASFEVELRNGTATQIDYNWLRVNPDSDYQITSAYLIDGATETPLNVVNEGGVFYIEYGSMTGFVDEIKRIRFEGTFTECSPQTIYIAQNYDCAGYPSSYTGLPFFNGRELSLEPVAAAIQLDILSQPSGTVDTCTDYDVVLEARNAGEGDLTSPTITFDIPGDISSITFSDVSVEYPRNSGNIESITPSISGNTVTLDLLLHSGINAQNGLSGSYGAASLDEQIAIIDMTLNPQCNYRSNTGTTYIISGNNPCGSPAVGSGSRLASEPVVITGAEPPYSTNSVALSSPNFEGCEMETVSVETYIVDGTTGSDDFTRITLPSGLVYVPGSFSSTGSVTATFVSANTVGNHQEIEIGLPAGATITDLIAYNFGVESTADICAGTYDIDLSTYVTTTGLTCGGVSCGTTEIETGQADTQITISKAVLEESSFSATAEYVQGANTNYAVEVGIENTGTEDLASGISYEVFCADGTGIKVGSPLYTGTLSQGIPVGTSIQEAFSFSSSTFCGANSNIVVEFAPGASNCFCDVLSVVIASTPSPAFGDITFVNDNITVNEANGTATLEVIFNGNFPGGFSVDFNSQTDLAIAPDDFILTNGTLNFNGTNGEIQQITIPIIDDTLIEPTENFLVNLFNPSSGILNILDTQADVNIQDNDFAGITIDDATANEGDNLVFTITASQAPLTDLVFDLSYVDISTIPADYSGPTTVTLLANTTSVSFNVAALDDDWFENTQDFDVVIALTSGSATITDDTGRGTILDTDQATVSTGNYDVLEDVGIVQLRVFLSPSGTNVGVEDAFTVDVVVNSSGINFPATEGSDYTGTTATISFPANSPVNTEFFIPLTIIDDNITEPSERVIQRLSNPSISGIGLAGPGGIVRIHDNDTSTITLQDITVDEAVGSTSYSFILSGQTQDPFDISYSSSNGTAIEPDDYTANSGTVSFTGSNSEIQSVTFTIIDDNFIEPLETFNVSGSYSVAAPAFTNALAQNIIFSNNPGAINITDNDGGAGTGITFDNDNITVDESAGTATVNVLLTGNVPGGFTLDYTTTDGSAVTPSDYTTTSGQLTFAGTDGETQPITIPIIDDNLIEALENLLVDLSNLSTGLISINDNQATVNITDNDGGAGTGISFDNDNITVDESAGTATVNVILTGNIPGGFTLDYTTTDASAVAPGDYTTTSGQLTFAGTDGETQPITVPIIDDNLIEALENLLVDLSNLSTGLISINDNQATVNITDNDGGAGTGISFDNDNITVDESAGTATVNVILTGNIPGGFTLDYTTTDASAFAPGDYTTTSGQLTFAGTDGETQPITVPIIDDNLIEALENLLVDLSNLSTGLISINDNQATVNITDNDGGVGTGISFDNDNITVDESAGTATVNVLLTGNVPGGFTLDYTTTDATAVAPGDYTTTSGQLTFAGTDGETQPITVPIIDDNLLETLENLLVDLSNLSTNLIYINDNQATINILDNDGLGAGEGISVADFTVDEGA
ncbi:beta strand repeat-containing protein, partial [Maribacter chungangensis]